MLHVACNENMIARPKRNLEEWQIVEIWERSNRLRWGGYRILNFQRIENGFPQRRRNSEPRPGQNLAVFPFDPFYLAHGENSVSRSMPGKPRSCRTSYGPRDRDSVSSAQPELPFAAGATGLCVPP